MSDENNNIENVGNGDSSVKKKQGEYDGSKQPMIAIGMLNSSQAICNALKRINKRREWIMDTRKHELQAMFNSDNAIQKRTALTEASKLKADTSKLALAEEALIIKRDEVNAAEMEELKGEKFPDIGIVQASAESEKSIDAGDNGGNDYSDSDDAESEEESE
jgi:hypothetical protein